MKNKLVPTIPESCPCNKQTSYTNCCGRFIDSKQAAQNAEQLMRSRFSAYATGHFQYIIDTQTSTNNPKLNVAALADNQIGITWKNLHIIATKEPDQVEFKAYYTHQKNWFVMHEKSQFIRQEGNWLYDQGTESSDTSMTPQRNHPCPCGSGKKFKKCCMP